MINVDRILEDFERSLIIQIPFMGIHHTKVGINLVKRLLTVIEFEYNLTGREALNKYSELVAALTPKDILEYEKVLKGYTGEMERKKLLMILRYFSEWLKDNTLMYEVYYDKEYERLSKLAQ